MAIATLLSAAAADIMPALSVHNHVLHIQYSATIQLDTSDCCAITQCHCGNVAQLPVHADAESNPESEL